MSLDGWMLATEDDPPVQAYVAEMNGEAPSEGSGHKHSLKHVIRATKFGSTCVQIDIDVVLKRSVAPLLDLPFDFITSRAFAFPAHARDRLGFVGCTGFYIAKPKSAPFCELVLQHINRNTFGHPLDQLVLNSLLVEADEDGRHWRETASASGEDFEMDAFEIQGCRIGVLPKETIERNDDLTGPSVFGNHFKTLLDHFIPA